MRARSPRWPTPRGLELVQDDSALELILGELSVPFMRHCAATASPERCDQMCAVCSPGTHIAHIWSHGQRG